LKGVGVAMDGPQLTTVVMIGGGLDNDNDPGIDGDPSGVVDTMITLEFISI
jgi:hypothetical protein